MIEEEDFVVTSSLSFHENKATAEEKFVKLQKSPTGITIVMLNCPEV